MDKAVSGSVADRLRSAFPAGTFTQVDVLEHGDDPAVEPGETAVRAFIDRAGQPADPARRAPQAVLFGFPSMFLGLRTDGAYEAPGFASVRTELGPADLATVDAVMIAGIASSRAEVMRWAIARIREDPAYAQIQERAREIGDRRRP